VDSLEGDPSVFESRPSEALPVTSKHGCDGDSDQNFRASDLRVIEFGLATKQQTAAQKE
jgi:hypothetical protein